MKQMNTSHRKIAPKKETTKKQSLQISISSLNGQVVLTPPPPARTMPRNRQNPKNIKAVRFFLVRNLSSERQVKARNPDATEAGGFITCLVRILPPPRVWFGAREGRCKPPVFWRRSATRKTTRFSVRDAKYDARRFHGMRRLETLSIATNLQLLCSPIYRGTISICRVTRLEFR